MTLAVGLLGASWAAPADTGAPDVVRKIFDTSEQYIRARNWKAWASQWSADGVMQPPNQAAVKGRANIEAWGVAFPQVESLSFTEVEVHVDGNLAYGTSRYRLTLKGGAPQDGKQLAVFHHTSDGKWEIVACSFNSDTPPPDGKPAAAK